jgi:hypothetical protein
MPEDQRLVLERELESDPALREALVELERLGRDWGGDQLEHLSTEELHAALVGGSASSSRRLLAHLGECRDCRFEVMLLLEGTEPVAVARRPARWALSVAASLALVAFGAWLGPLLGPRATRSSPAGPSHEVVSLDAVRDSGGAGSTLELAGHEVFELRFQARIPEAEASFELVDGNGERLMVGTLQFPGGEGPLRSARVLVPASALVPGGHALVVRSASLGERRFVFLVRP